MLAISTYEAVLSIHVMAVVVFLGITFAFPVIGATARKAPQHAPFAIALTETIQRTLVIPGFFVLLITGMYLMGIGEFKFENATWASVSLLLLLLAMAVSMGIIYPAVKRARKAIEQAVADGTFGQGPPPPEFLRAVQLSRKIGPILNLNVLVITFLMVAKPF